MTIFTHACLGSNDLERSNRFYDAALGALGVRNLGPLGDKATMYGKASPEFIVFKPIDGAPATVGNGSTIGFAAATRAEVREFYSAGLDNGGTDEGAPGPRSFTPTAYAAYLRDPDGNKICAYCFKDGE